MRILTLYCTAKKCQFVYVHVISASFEKSVVQLILSNSLIYLMESRTIYSTHKLTGHQYTKSYVYHMSTQKYIWSLLVRIEKSQICISPTWVTFTEMHTVTVSTQARAFYWLLYRTVWSFSLIIQVWEGNGIQEPDFWAFRSYCKWGRDLAEKNRNCLPLGILRTPQATMGIKLYLSIQMNS